MKPGAQVIFTHEDQGKAFDGDIAKRPIVIAPGACPACANGIKHALGVREPRKPGRDGRQQQNRHCPDHSHLVGLCRAQGTPVPILEIYAADLFSAMAGEK